MHQTRKADLIIAVDDGSKDRTTLILEEYREKQRCTVIMSTHSPMLAANAAGRLIVMCNGKIEDDGKPEEILSNPDTEWAKSFTAGWKI